MKPGCDMRENLCGDVGCYKYFRSLVLGNGPEGLWGILSSAAIPLLFSFMDR